LTGVLFILWLAPGKSRRASTVLAVCALALVSIYGFNIVQNYYESTQNVTSRVATWKTATEDALEQPTTLVFGYGFEHFQAEVLARRLGDVKVALHSGTLVYLHSGHLQVLLEFGIVGVALAILWLFSVFVGAIRDAGSIRVVSLLGGALAFVAYVSVENFLATYVAVIFAVVMALAEAEAEAATSTQPDHPLPPVSVK